MSATWLSDVLRTNQTAVADLTVALLEKTGGNPFFLRRALVNLHAAGALHMDSASGSWRWDIDAVRRAELADNMVADAIARLHQLPSALLQLLTLAACVGHRFDANLLATISGKDPAEILMLLGDAEEQGLVTGDSRSFHGTSGRMPDTTSLRDRLSSLSSQGGGRYEFVHPRLQQAAYGLLAGPLRQELHLRIARHLLALPASEREEWAYDLTEQCRPHRWVA